MPYETGLSRRRFLGSVGALAALNALVPVRLLGQEGPKTSIAELRRGVGTFTGRGGTIGWLVNEDALVVVDTQMPGTAEICLSELEKKSPRMIDLLINSHHHFDHTAGNGIFRPRSKRILAHANVPKLQKAAAERADRLEGQVYADMVYEEEWTGSFGDETVTLRYWGPAHTGGDSVIHFEKANVVHMGDLVFNRMAPYIDTKGGSRVDNWVTVLEKAVKQFDDDTRYIFGHGNDAFGITGVRTDLIVMRDFLAALHAYVSKGVKEGRSEKELSSIDSLKGFEVFSDGGSRDRFKGGIRETYAQLTAAEPL